MSADLFAEFGSTPSQGQQSAGPGVTKAQPPPTFSFFDDFSNTPVPVTQSQSQLSQPNTTQAPPDDDPDDWGDFEGVSTSQQTSTSIPRDPFAFTSTQTSLPSQSSWQKAPVLKAKKSADPNVLFDAEDDPDDDFGDFEDADTGFAPAAPAQNSSNLVDLLGDMSVSQPQPPPRPSVTNQKATTSTSRKFPILASTKRSSNSGFGTVTRAKQPSPVPSSSSAAKQEDAWDTFDDWEASIPTKPQAKAPVKPRQPRQTDASTPQPSLPTPAVDEVQPGELPPTNVPPPGVLLSIFPPLFEEAQNKLFKPMAAQPLPMRNQLLAESGTILYLEAYLVLASVAARIIAGRKLRWKRDAHLSQGMRIGPASSRATSGMKLTGIDKSENIKEEREVADVVRVWKDQVGRLRHVVAAANQIKAGTLGAVTDLQETMPVRTLKQSEGGIPAPKPCMLCGLKREERVGSADQGVQDSFGEWWVEQVMMHRGMSRALIVGFGSLYG